MLFANGSRSLKMRLSFLVYRIIMPKPLHKKERWTLTVDPRLKKVVIAEARRRRVYPSRALEDLIRERFNPFGHTDISDPTTYVRTLRRKSRELTDEAFGEDLKQWEKVAS